MASRARARTFSDDGTGRATLSLSLARRDLSYTAQVRRALGPAPATGLARSASP